MTPSVVPTTFRVNWFEQVIAARKAWLGLVHRLDQDANVKDVCVGTNKGFTVQYYMDRERRVGDLHGQAPLLWCASALLR